MDIGRYFNTPKKKKKITCTARGKYFGECKGPLKKQRKNVLLYHRMNPKPNNPISCIHSSHQSQWWGFTT